MLIGDHSPTRADVGRQDPGRVVRRALEWAQRGVGSIPGIAEAVVVCRLAAPEVGVEALGRELVEALDGVLQFVCGNVDLAGQVADRVATHDGAPLDQLFGQATLLQRVGARDVSARHTPRRRPSSTAPPCWRTSPCRPRRRSSTRCRTACRSRRRRWRPAAAARAERRGGRAAVGDENRWQPPRLVQQIGLRAEAHRRLQHFAGVAGVRDRPLALVGLIAAVPAAHLGVVAEAAGREQNSLARLDIQRLCRRG